MTTPGAADSTGIADRTRTVFIVSVLLTLAVYLVPGVRVLGYPLLLISTVVHELGHGVTAWLVGGEFSHFVMRSDASGVAYTRTGGDLARAMVSAGGLIGPAIGAMLSFVMARRARSARYFLGALGVALVLAEIVVVRSMFGLVFIGAFAAVCLLIAWFASNQIAQLALTFLGVQLALSVYSRGDYLFTESAGPGLASDVAHISDAIGMPYWFWGGVCGAISLFAVAIGAFALLRRRGD